jgi:hypothetical protein
MRRRSGLIVDEGWSLPCALFHALRDEWVRQGGDEQRTYTRLADLLDVHPVSISQWGSDRRPPWRVVRRLLAETSARIVVSPHGFDLLVDDEVLDGPA